MNNLTCPVCGYPFEEWFLDESQYICSNPECDNEKLYDENGGEIEERGEGN
jgi:hypothetical protein